MATRKFDLQLFADDPVTDAAIASSLSEAAEALKSAGLSPDPATGEEPVTTDGEPGEESLDDAEIVEPEEPSDTVPDDDGTRASKRIRQLIEERNLARADLQKLQQPPRDPRIELLDQHPELRTPENIAAIFGQTFQKSAVPQGEQEPDWEQAFPDDEYQQSLARVAWRAEKRIEGIERKFEERESRREQEAKLAFHRQAVEQEAMAVLALPEIAGIPSELHPQLMSDLRQKAADMMRGMKPPTLLDAYQELYGKKLRETKKVVELKRQLPPASPGNRMTNAASYAGPEDCIKAAMAELRQKK